MSPRTAALRPDIDLTEEQVAQARQMRRAGSRVDWIAMVLGVSLEATERALLAMRTPKDNRTRASLNVTLEARDYVLGLQKRGEAVHQTVDRILGEHEAMKGGA
jgi:hypothetical protein